MAETLKCTTAPTVCPLTLYDAKMQCRITSDAENELLQSVLKLAWDEARRISRRELTAATWTWKFDSLYDIGDRYMPESGVIVMPKAPLLSVTSIKYYDTAGVQQTFSSGSYTVDTNADPGRVYLKYGESWPSADRGHTSDWEIIFVAGYSASATASVQRAAVPEAARHAMRIMVADFYRFREDIITGTIVAKTPTTAEDLLLSIRDYARI